MSYKYGRYKETIDTKPKEAFVIRTKLLENNATNQYILSITILDQFKDKEYYQEYTQNSIPNFNIKDVAQTFHECIENSMKHTSLQDSRLKLAIMQYNGWCYVTLGDGNLLPTFAVRPIKSSRANRKISEPVPYTNNRHLQKRSTNTNTNNHYENDPNQSEATHDSRNGNGNGNGNANDLMNATTTTTTTTQPLLNIDALIEENENENANENDDDGDEHNGANTNADADTTPRSVNFDSAVEEEKQFFFDENIRNGDGNGNGKNGKNGKNQKKSKSENKNNNMNRRANASKLRSNANANGDAIPIRVVSEDAEVVAVEVDTGIGALGNQSPLASQFRRKRKKNRNTSKGQKNHNGYVNRQLYSQSLSFHSQFEPNMEPISSVVDENGNSVAVKHSSFYAKKMSDASSIRIPGIREAQQIAIN